MNDPTGLIVWLLEGALKGVNKHQPVIAFREEAREHSEDPQ